MQNILVVVDMQNDFIDGALGTKEAVAIVPAVKEKIKNFEGRIIFTRDTHEENYMDMCIGGTDVCRMRRRRKDGENRGCGDRVSRGISCSQV